MGRRAFAVSDLHPARDLIAYMQRPLPWLLNSTVLRSLPLRLRSPGLVGGREGRSRQLELEVLQG